MLGDALELAVRIETKACPYVMIVTDLEDSIKKIRENL